MLTDRTTLAWCLAGVLLLGCGSSSSSSAGSAGAGGNAHASGGAAGSAGSTAGGATSMGGAAMSGAGSGGADLPTLGDSPVEACIAYAVAACERRSECEGTSAASCIGASFNCPDSVLSIGSTRTPAVLKACAQSYKDYSCALLLAGKLPDCVSPGTKKLGEPCVYPSQCESLTCPNKGGCGVCKSPVALGGDCTAASSTCDGNTFCSTSGKCVSLEGKAEGSSCELDELCHNGFCVSGVCVGYAGAGESCEATNLCANNLYCDAADFKCKPPAAAGQPCFEDAATGALPCAAGSVCNTTAAGSLGTCGPPPAIGAPCFTFRDRPISDGCGAGNHCKPNVSPSVCAAAGERGASCFSNAECAQSLQCLCPDGASSCQERMCSTLRYSGETCDQQGNACHPAFDCVAGKCVPSQLRGNFEKACSATP